MIRIDDQPNHHRASLQLEVKIAISTRGRCPRHHKKNVLLLYSPLLPCLAEERPFVKETETIKAPHHSIPRGPVNHAANFSPPAPRSAPDSLCLQWLVVPQTPQRVQKRGVRRVVVRVGALELDGALYPPLLLPRGWHDGLGARQRGLLPVQKNRAVPVLSVDAPSRGTLRCYVL